MHLHLMTMNNRLEKKEHKGYLQVADHNVVTGNAGAEVEEIRSLRHSVCRLLSENEELCDLCCFLDDDRQRHRRDAAEWQKLHQQLATELTKKVLLFFCPTCGSY